MRAACDPRRAPARVPSRSTARLAPLILLGAAALLPGAPAQSGGAVSFRTADGSRFVLLPTLGPPLVHWAVATPAGALEDPAGLEGLAVACARASLNGTWRTGSRDPAAERAALEQADAAARAARTAAGSAGDDGVAAARAAAAALSDPQAFRRVLAGAPALDLTLTESPWSTVLSLTTTVDGLARVAELLLERREDGALRGLAEAWAVTIEARRPAAAADPMEPLRAEAISLAFPGHPLGRTGERPAASAAPDRATALQVWQRTQRPDRSVHVLIGAFQVETVRPLLERTFASTALQEPVPPLPAPRHLPASRRSSVPGTDRGAVVALRLPAGAEPAVAACAASWLGPGPNTLLTRELARRGVTAAARASVVLPGQGLPGLLLLELWRAPAGVDAAALGLELIGVAAQRAPEPVDLGRAHAALMAEHEARTRSPRARAATAAELLLRYPSAPVLPSAAPPAPAAVHDLLRAASTSPPSVVEWKPL